MVLRTEVTPATRALTSFLVTDTVRTEVILYRRRAMHKDDAGIPTPAPMRNLVAKDNASARPSHVSWKFEILTDIAPDGGDVFQGAVPNDGINKLDETGQRGPEHINASSRIPGLEMPWQGYEREDEAQEREEGKERVGRVRLGSEREQHGGSTGRRADALGCLRGGTPWFITLENVCGQWRAAQWPFGRESH